MKAKLSAIRHSALLRATVPGESLLPLFRPIEDLLVAGGDGRIALARPGRENLYGCLPFPHPEGIDLSSSTASTISPEAYGRAQVAREQWMARLIVEEPERAFAALVGRMRTDLRAHLRLDDGIDIVFAPSGTDAQLHALLIGQTLLRGPLTTVVVGADQTGSGTIDTAQGRHFGTTTAAGIAVEKGAPLADLDIETVAIPFAAPDGTLRDLADMDEAVAAAVAGARRHGRKVLLLAMDCSKLGARAPSDPCLADIAARWPDDVRIVIDACQMRLSRRRLGALLDRGYLVLVTGSKFFTGPAFSGAILVPRKLADDLGAAPAMPAGFAAYGTALDWPSDWGWSRHHPRRQPNLGQMLRWECALEEMRLYYAVPADFRHRVLAECGEKARAKLAGSKRLAPVAALPSPQPTIFSFRLRLGSGMADLETCRRLYRAMRRDLSSHFAVNQVAAIPCQIGQPVALAKGGALRMALSARTVRSCWAENEPLREKNIRRRQDEIDTAIDKLELLASATGTLDLP